MVSPCIQLGPVSSNVLHSSSLLLKVIWRCSTSLLHYMVSQNMVSQSKNGFPKDGFSIIIWFHYMVSQSSYGSIIWFLNHHMVPLYGFSIIVWFHYMVSQSSYGSIRWFLNQKMVSQNMVSQSKNGIPKYGFSIKIW